jgi:hypothetical protein
MVTSRCICTVQIHQRIQTLQKHNSIFFKLITENYSWEIRIPVSYFGGLGIDSRLLGQLSWLSSVTPGRYWNRALEINNDCFIFTYFKMYCHVWGVAWLTIMGSGLDDWIYWNFYYNYNQLLSRTRSIPYWTTSVISSTVTSDERRITAHTLSSLTNDLQLFYKLQAARI